MSAILLEVFAAAAAASFTIGETLSVISGGCEAPVLAVQALGTWNFQALGCTVVCLLLIKANTFRERRREGVGDQGHED